MSIIRISEVWGQVLERVQQSCDLHASHGQKRYQRQLGSFVELQLPYNDSGKKGKNQIGNNGEHAVESCQRYNDVGVDTFSIQSLVPKI